MWTKELFGTDVYHLVAAFVIYSILGWCVESIYMSFCNRRLTNRGFAKSPFCPIYGFGAVFGYLMLRPLKGNLVVLYFTAAILATVFEYLVGLGMKKIFGLVWWDYNEKPLNYKGMICLESTIAWGFYGIIIVTFLHNQVIRMIDQYHRVINGRVILVILAIVAVDYVIQILKALNINMREKVVDKYLAIKARWY